MLNSPTYNTYNYFVVKNEWKKGDPIPHNVRKVILVKYESAKDDGSIIYFEVPIFILNEAEKVLSEIEILKSVDAQYGTIAHRIGQTCIYEK